MQALRGIVPLEVGTWNLLSLPDEQWAYRDSNVNVQGHLEPYRIHDINGPTGSDSRRVPPALIAEYRRALRAVSRSRSRSLSREPANLLVNRQPALYGARSRSLSRSREPANSLGNRQPAPYGAAAPTTMISADIRPYLPPPPPLAQRFVSDPVEQARLAQELAASRQGVPSSAVQHEPYMQPPPRDPRAPPFYQVDDRLPPVPFYRTNGSRFQWLSDSDTRAPTPRAAGNVARPPYKLYSVDGTFLRDVV